MPRHPHSPSSEKRARQSDASSASAGSGELAARIAIGWFVRDRSGSDAIRQAVASINAVFDECEETASDADYVRASHWPRVVAAATSLLAIMGAHDRAASEPPHPSRVNGDLSSSYDCFGEVVHRSFDDTRLSEDPEGCTGWYLRDQSEVVAVRDVVAALDAVLDRSRPRSPARTT